MDITKTAEAADVAGLREVLSKIADQELSEEVFSELARAAFGSLRESQELDGLLQEWDSEARAFSSKGAAEVVAGYLLLLKGDADQAEERLKAQKKLPWGAYHYARFLVSRQRFEEALKVISAVCEKTPDFVPGVYLKIRTLSRCGQEEEALQMLSGLGEEESQTSRWIFHDGYCKERSGEYREAIDSYREAVDRDPENADAWFRLAFLLDLYGTQKEDERDEAIKAYEQCVKSSPVHTRALINLGLLYEDRERYHDACKCYEAVLKIRPNHARARLFLGDSMAATRMFYDRDQEKKADRHSQVLKIPVSDFELSVRSRNCLQKMQIDTLGDLIMKTEQELLSYKNFGETSLKEIRDMLGQKGLVLGQGLEEKGREPPASRNPLEATAPAEVLEKPIEELNFSVRSRRCMERLSVRNVRDLINKTEVELMSAKNFGMTSLNEIKKKLAELGLGLRS